MTAVLFYHLEEVTDTGFFYQRVFTLADFFAEITKSSADPVSRRISYIYDPADKQRRNQSEDACHTGNNLRGISPLLCLRHIRSLLHAVGINRLTVITIRSAIRTIRLLYCVWITCLLYCVRITCPLYCVRITCLLYCVWIIRLYCMTIYIVLIHFIIFLFHTALILSTHPDCNTTHFIAGNGSVMLPAPSAVRPSEHSDQRRTAQSVIRLQQLSVFHHIYFMTQIQLAFLMGRNHHCSLTLQIRLQIPANILFTD